MLRLKVVEPHFRKNKQRFDRIKANFKLISSHLKLTYVPLTKTINSFARQMPVILPLFRSYSEADCPNRFLVFFNELLLSKFNARIIA